MRTQNPANIRADFEAAINEVRSAVTAAEQAIGTDPPRKLVTEYSFVATAALFEGFVSDLVVAYINQNSQTFRNYLLGLISITATDEFAKRARQHVVTGMPHLTVEDIRKILDPSDYNVTFPTTGDMKAAAGRWLSPDDSDHFTATTAQHCAVIDLTKGVRNFLAHRSQAADTAMQAVLQAIDLPPELRRGQNCVQDVGAFLRAQQGGRSRFEHFIDLLSGLAQQFCP